PATSGTCCWCTALPGLSASNFVYDLIVPDRRATWLAVHNIIASSGIFSRSSRAEMRWLRAQGGRTHFSTAAAGSQVRREQPGQAIAQTGRQATAIDVCLCHLARNLAAALKPFLHPAPEFPAVALEIHLEV